jgi:glycosyltransferase involved in cell wall biosynthesis
MVSIITAHQPKRNSFLRYCYKSILKQEIDFEWLIEIDGPMYQLDEEIAADPRVKIEATGINIGQAAARNLALARSAGEFVFSLDDDDVLIPKALFKLSVALGSSDLGAAIGNVYKLEKGQLKPWHSRGVVSNDLYRVDQNIPIQAAIKNKDKFGTHCLAACAFFWKTDTLLHLGGWTAIKGSEDTYLVAKYNFDQEILHPNVDTLIYRIHNDQESIDEDILALREKNWPLIKRFIGYKGLDLKKAWLNNKT